MLILPIKINNQYIKAEPYYPQKNYNFLKTYPNDSVTFSSKFNNTSARKVIILIGAPNSGKGTVARALSKHLSIPYIGGGDIVRKEIKKGYNFSNIINQFMEYLGSTPKYTQLVKCFVCNSIKEKLKLPAYKNGVIIEGFPRSIEEAKMLKNILDAEDNIELKIVHLDVPTPLLYKRSANRFICKECNKTYSLKNIEELPKCECGGTIIKRNDDTPEILGRRIQKYETETLPLINYYGDKVVNILVKDDSTALNESLEKIISKIFE